MCSGMYVSVYAHMHACVSVCLSFCLFVCLAVCLYVCLSVWTYVCMDGWRDGRMVVCTALTALFVDACVCAPVTLNGQTKQEHTSEQPHTDIGVFRFGVGDIPGVMCWLWAWGFGIEQRYGFRFRLGLMPQRVKGRTKRSELGRRGIHL